MVSAIAIPVGGSHHGAHAFAAGVPEHEHGEPPQAHARRSRIADRMRAINEGLEGALPSLAGNNSGSEGGNSTKGSFQGASSLPRPFASAYTASPASFTGGGSLLGTSYGTRSSAGSLPGRELTESKPIRTNNVNIQNTEFVSLGVSPYGRSRDDVLPTLGGKLTPDVVKANFLTDAHLKKLETTYADASVQEVASSYGVTPILSPISEALKTSAKGGAAYELIHQGTHAAQELRRQVLREGAVVIITTGSMGKRFVYERLEQLGVNTYNIDGPDSWAQVLEDEGVIERFLPVDMTDSSKTLELCANAIQSLIDHDGVEVDGIATFCEIAVPLASRLAEIFGLPGNPSSAVDAARDKHATRIAVANAGLPSVQSRMLPSPDTLVRLPSNHDNRIVRKKFVANMTEEHLNLDKLLEIGGQIGYPLVMKPVSGAASIGVLKVESAEKLSTAYLKVLRDVFRAKVNAGALVMGSDDEDDDVDSVANGNGGGGRSEADAAQDWPTIMLEEYLDGEEVDVDVILSEGKSVYNATSDNWPCEEPWFNETGDNAPCLLGLEIERALETVGVDCCHALGLTTGVFHVELKATSRGPRLIEVNTRMGGGPVRDINLRVNGVDLVEEHIFASVGIPCNPPFRIAVDGSEASSRRAEDRDPLDCVAGYTLNAPKTGTVTEGAEAVIMKWAEVSYVLSAEVFVHPGDKVTSKADGLPTWMGEIRVHGDTAADAKDRAEKMRDTLLAEILPFIR